MTLRSPEDIDQTVELLVSRLLLTGLRVSMAVLVVGLVVLVARHPEQVFAASGLSQWIGPTAAFPHSLPELGRQLAEGRGQAILALGLLLLIATPTLRVVISIIGFGIERDWLYVVLTVYVLAVLLFSFAAGKAG